MCIRCIEPTVGQGRAAARRPAWARGPVPGGAPLLARCGIHSRHARAGGNERAHARGPSRSHARAALQSARSVHRILLLLRVSYLGGRAVGLGLGRPDVVEAMGR